MFFDSNCLDMTAVFSGKYCSFDLVICNALRIQIWSAHVAFIKTPSALLSAIKRIADVKQALTQLSIQFLKSWCVRHTMETHMSEVNKQTFSKLTM